MLADKVASLNAMAEALENAANIVVVVLGGSHAQWRETVELAAGNHKSRFDLKDSLP